MKSRAYIIIGVLAMLLFASCGQQHKAESTVTRMDSVSHVLGIIRLVGVLLLGPYCGGA